jgi:AraC-like DNA-binding protein
MKLVIKQSRRSLREKLTSMELKAERENIRVWRPADVDKIELRVGKAVSQPYPRHWHEEYNLCLLEAGAGELHYRGAGHVTPPASLYIVHPGEVHSNHAYCGQPCSFRNLYAEAEVVRAVASELAGIDRPLPFFRPTVIFDKEIISLYLGLYAALEKSASTLERQSRLMEFFACLINRYSENRPQIMAYRRERLTISRVREYLAENYSENVSMEYLSQIAGLSPFHLSRVFSEEVGMPPHAFQTQVRIARAKSLLSRGWTISRVAAETGFADQSHLTRHFKRLVLITPGQYLQGNRQTQDASSLF